MPLPLLGLGASLLLKLSPVGKVLRWIPFKGWIALILATAIGVHLWQDRREITKRDAIIAAKDARIDGLKTQQLLEVYQKELSYAAVTDITNKLDKSNQAVKNLQTSMQAQELSAQINAVRAFNQGREAAEKLRSPTSQIPPGHEAMNSWIAERVK